jgi:hypothetical protein
VGSFPPQFSYAQENQQNWHLKWLAKFRGQFVPNKTFRKKCELWGKFKDEKWTFFLNKTKVMRRGCSKVVSQPFVLALVVITASKPAKWQTLLQPNWSL